MPCPLPADVVEFWRREGVMKMVTKEQVAHELAIAVAQTYIADESRHGEYRESGVEGAALDAFSTYTRAYNAIIRAK